MISYYLLKKIISVYLTISLVITGLIGLLVFDRPVDTPNVEATVLTVDTKGHGDFISIQAAIDNASSGYNNNNTTIIFKYPDYIYWNPNQQVNVSTTHFQYFPMNAPPNQTNLLSPLNNSYISNPTPSLTWSSGSDPDNDTLSYYVQVDEFSGDWSTLIASNHTKTGVLSWDVPQVLSDDSKYQWRVRANDSMENGSWSDIWKFTIDTDIPVANKPNCYCIYNNTAIVNWTWIKSMDTGSGIKGYYIYIGTTPSGTNIVDGEWTTNNWYQRTNLLDGVTYYCRIKVENGAGTISDFSLSSDGILIDLDTPFAYQPKVPGVYNNTGTIRWTWQTSVTTGSGIVGYYIFIGTSIGASDVVNGEFTVNNWYERSGLLDDKTYYCRIRVENGAGTLSDFSSSSVGITIDLDTPECSTPTTTVKYNNTGSVIWTWSPAVDTGSGILGYYVTVTKGPAETIVVDNAWTTNNHFEKSLLQDGNVYYCKIKPKNGADTIGEFSASSTGVHIDLTAPKPPIGLSAEPASWTSINSFKFTWANPSDFSGISGVYYKIDTTPKNNNDGRFISTGYFNELSNISFIADGEHVIYVWLMDRAGNVDYQNSASTRIYLDTQPPEAPISVTVTPSAWSSINSFSIDWAMPVDLSGIKTGAYYYFGNAPPTSQAQGTWTINKPIKITGISEGQSKVYLWLEDVAGNSNFEKVGNAILKLDTQIPSLTHIPTSTGIEGKDITITVNATDENSGVKDVMLYFKSLIDNSYSIMEMNLKFGTTSYSVKISGAKVTPEGLEYYIKARDNSNPANIVYFGYNGVTKIQPNADTDIDIFISIQPVVIRTSPKGSGISVHTNINITFNKQMNKQSVEDAFSINPSVTGIFNWEGNKVIFTPDMPLAYQTKYTVTLSQVATDLGDLTLPVVLKFSFTTELEPEIIEPEDNKEEKDDQAIIMHLQ